MIGWLKKRRTKKELSRFEKILTAKLGEYYPTMIDIHKNSKLEVFYFKDKPSGITLLHSINGDYLNRNKKKHNVNFRVDGLEIKRKDKNDFVKLPVTVTSDLIGTIEMEDPQNFWKNFDMDQLRANNLRRTELVFENEDIEKLLKILKNVDEGLKSKLEIEDTFEIELGDKKFLTMLDMEDGNYVGVNSKGQVFRLLHDSYEQARLINKSVKEFLTTYSGDKNDLNKYFEE
jgi:hypothetical protein